MKTIKTHIAQAIRIFGIMALVAAFAAAAFPTRSFAANSDMGKLIVSVYQTSNNPGASTQLLPLGNADIEVFNAAGASVASVTTDSSGATTLELPKGVYKVRVSAPNYTSASGSAAVDAGKATSIKFELRPTGPQIGGK